MSFAEGTVVPVERSKIEIEGILLRYGATKFISGWDQTTARIEFAVHGRRVRFTLPLPVVDEVKADLKAGSRKWRQSYGIPESVVSAAMAAEERRRWRCLLLAIKSRLEVVATKIETFEQAFFAHVVTDDNSTIYERIAINQKSDIRLLSSG